MYDSSGLEAGLTQANGINAVKEANTTTTVALVYEQNVIFLCGSLDKFNAQLAVHSQTLLDLGRAHF